MDELKTVPLSTLYKTDVISRAYYKEIFLKRCYSVNNNVFLWFKKMRNL